MGPVPVVIQAVDITACHPRLVQKWQLLRMDIAQVVIQAVGIIVLPVVSTKELLSLN